MPSTFECPSCASHNSKLAINIYDSESNIETATYQCMQCFHLFDIPRFLLEANGKKLVTVYAYDCLDNLVPVDSYWATPRNLSVPNSELTPTFTKSPKYFDKYPIASLLSLLFNVVSIVFGVWLLILGVG